MEAKRIATNAQPGKNIAKHVERWSSGLKESFAEIFLKATAAYKNAGALGAESVILQVMKLVSS